MVDADTATAYLALGSNLEDPPQQIRRAIHAIRRIPGTRVVADSGLYLSKPLVPSAGAIVQADYYNAVVAVRTSLGPYDLLAHLQQIETNQGRLRTHHWGPRTIDLDILMFDDLCSDDQRLTLPHPGIAEREFVLYPLQRIDDSLQIPGRGMLSELIRNCPENGLQYLGAIESDEA